MTSTPRYVPQCAQTRWGSFGCWHWGQAVGAAGVSPSWARRVSRRVLVCLLLGFGMVEPLSFWCGGSERRRPAGGGTDVSGNRELLEGLPSGIAAGGSAPAGPGGGLAA